MSMLGAAMEMPGDYFRGALTGNLGDRVDPSQFNKKIGMPSNFGTDMLTAMLVDPLTMAGLVGAFGTRAGRRGMKSLTRSGAAKKFLASEEGSLGRQGRMTIKGEYWLDENGSPGLVRSMAEDDIGNYVDHAEVARKHLQRRIMQQHPTLGRHAVGEEIDFEEFLKEAAPDLHDTLTADPLEKGWDRFRRTMREIHDLEKDRVISWDKARSVDELLKSLNVDEEIFDLARGASTKDIRQYAQKNWGWTRMEGNNLGAWGLDRTKLKKIADGIGSATDKPDDIYGQVFDIYDEKTGKFYQGVPYDTLEAGDMKALRDFDTSHLSRRH